MIINTIISGSSARNNISLSSPELVLFRNEGDTIELQFNYLNSKSFKGAATLFYNNEIIQGVVIESGESNIFDINGILESGGTGLYKFRIVVTDSEASIDFLEFSILYNYQNIHDFSFVYNSVLNGYVLTQYTGITADVLIPPLFIGEEGALPVVGIDNGVFFDRDTLITVSIPETIQFINASAFFSCSNLRSVTVLAEVPPVLAGDSVTGTTNVFNPYNELSLLKIYVPAGSVDSYKQAQYWQQYSNDILPIVI
jgi:hypothetical protein